MSGLLNKQFQFSKMIGEFIVWLYSQGYTCQLGDAWRSTDKLYVPTGKEGFEDDDKYSYQELLFYNKKTKLTYGKHNDRLAVDLIIYKDDTALKNEELRPIGEKWEAMGGRWGGRFGVPKEEYNAKIGWDAGHFEMS
jgi:hypothetical protein